jgi:MerR family transcriptional regulator, light-induced transcriptional regulator
MAEGLLRIGELSRRSGVSPELLRAWERRYGLLQPARSSGGLRLYTLADLERVRVMQEHLASGMAAAEAAAVALGADPVAEARAGASPAALRAELAAALDDYDEPRAQAVLDRLLAVATVDSILGDVVLPYLRDLGERWARDEVSVAQEHFASGVIRGRLLGLARGWGQGIGPVALLACVPGEQHDLGLICFGLALRARGWRIVYLGPDAPIETVEEASRLVAARFVVFHGIDRALVAAVLDRIRSLARDRAVAVGGAAADAIGNDGVLVLRGDVIAEAARVAALA